MTIDPKQTCTDRRVQSKHMSDCEDAVRKIIDANPLDDDATLESKIGSQIDTGRWTKWTAGKPFVHAQIEFSVSGNANAANGYSGDVQKPTQDENGYEVGGQYPTTYPFGLKLKARILFGDDDAYRGGIVAKAFDWKYGVNNRPGAANSQVGDILAFGVGHSGIINVSSLIDLGYDVYYHHVISSNKVEQANDIGFADISADGFGISALVQFKISNYFRLALNATVEGAYDKHETGGSRPRTELISGHFVEFGAGILLDF